MGVVSKPAASDFCLKAELHGIPQALLLLLVLPAVWTAMTPMTLPPGAFASMMRNSEKSLPTSKELTLLPGGSSEPSVSEQYLLVVQPTSTNHLGKTTYTAPIQSIHLIQAFVACDTCKPLSISR